MTLEATKLSRSGGLCTETHVSGGTGEEGTFCDVLGKRRIVEGGRQRSEQSSSSVSCNRRYDCASWILCRWLDDWDKQLTILLPDYADRFSVNIGGKVDEMLTLVKRHSMNFLL